MTKYKCDYCKSYHEEGTHPHNSDYNFHIRNQKTFLDKLKLIFGFKAGDL